MCIFVKDRYVIKLILLNLKHGAQRSHSAACSLKKLHTIGSARILKTLF